ncbi:MAG: hypothetical protein ACE5EQ_12060, partial [Phycisphaerae bacterium]
MSEDPRENPNEDPQENPHGEPRDNPGEGEDRPTKPVDPARLPTVSAGGGSPAGRSNEPPPERIGPYKIREQIGAGGMGVVYLAEQLRPVRRKVALKLIKSN